MSFSFTYNEKSKHVTINLGSTKIPKEAFDYSEIDIVVESVDIPDSVATIGDTAFTNNKLMEVVIPDSVTT